MILFVASLRQHAETISLFDLLLLIAPFQIRENERTANARYRDNNRALRVVSTLRSLFLHFLSLSVPFFYRYPRYLLPYVGNERELCLSLQLSNFHSMLNAK